jgi:Lrp/AsnC family transcriptional regulator
MSTPPKLDPIDRRIIDILQKDASLSIQKVGEMVGLSQNACWRRIKTMEDEGVLKARVAVFDAEKLGYPLTVFAILRVREHSADWYKKFVSQIVSRPEVVEFYRMSGDVDYMAKLVVRDVKHYDEIYKEIVKIGPLLDVSASFAMEDIKNTTAVPVEES